jgi:Tfp pilus assembly protein PilX
MTPISKKYFIKKVKDITINSTIALTIMGNSVALQSCGSNSSNENDYEYEEVYTKGVKTYISETSKGIFKITNEKEVAIDSSVAIVSYLDGQKDSISPKVVQGLIDSEVKSNPTTSGQRTT